MLYKIVKSIKDRGFVETVYLIKERIIAIYTSFHNRRFDITYGVETSQHEWDCIVQSDLDHSIYAYNYEPVFRTIFYKSMSKINIDFSEFVFLDLGSGKGKALMLASTYPFKKIIGVEFIAQIHTIAKKNIDKFIKHKGINNFQLHHKDASVYNFPNDNIVLFLYNPFNGKVLDAVIKKIENHITQVSKNIYIVYHYPINSEPFDQSDFLELLYDSRRYKIYSKK